MSISITELENKLQKIDEEIKKLENERNHIRWFVEKYSKRTPRGSVAPIPGLPTASREEVKNAVLNVLRTNGTTMKSKDLYDALVARGMNVMKNTFDSLMSQWSKPENEVAISKPGYGHYKYEEKSF